MTTIAFVTNLLTTSVVSCLFGLMVRTPGPLPIDSLNSDGDLLLGVVVGADLQHDGLRARTCLGRNCGVHLEQAPGT
jgi:hypothetical protein